MTRTKALAGIFAVSGLLHFAVPGVYEAIVPRWLPGRRALVYGSGVAELACAGGLAGGQPWAGPASVALLIGVWPANVQMAVDSSRAAHPWWRQLAVWARVPLQIPLIRMARAAS